LRPSTCDSRRALSAYLGFRGLNLAYLSYCLDGDLGGRLLADAAARVVISFTLPTDVVPCLGGALWPVTFLIIQVVSIGGTGVRPPSERSLPL
jgi:hypothetical protein